MSKTVYEDLGKLLEEVKSGELPEGSVLTNEQTGERVVLKEGSLKFLTQGEYVSQEVPLTRGMILAQWSVEKPKHKLIEMVEAIEKVADGVPILVDGQTVRSIPELLQELVINQALSLSTANGMTYAVNKGHLAPSKYARKTTTTDVWGILMDRNLQDMPVEQIADKYGISVRSVYYILDGTHHVDVYNRFNQLMEAGGLHFDSKE